MQYWQVALNVIETSMDPVTAPLEHVTAPPIFTDGFGARFLASDAEAGDPVEILAFHPALVDDPDFAVTVGVRVARLAGARHALFARVRRVDRPTPQSLLLVSDRVTGWRLADVLDGSKREGLAFDTSAVLNLLRQLIPAVALFGRHQRDLSVGTIAPERLILTPQGRLVIAEYVLGEAVEKLSLPREHLWRTFRVPVAAFTGASRDAQRSDVLAIGIVALSLLLGRRLRDDEFPDALGDLLQLASEHHGGVSRPVSPRLASWVARALQLEGHKGLQSPKDAQVAFEELLATDRDYVTSPALLETFIAQFQEIAGPPPEIAKVEEVAVARSPAPSPPAPSPPPASPPPLAVFEQPRVPEPLPVAEAPRRVEPTWQPEEAEPLWAAPEPVVSSPADLAPTAEEEAPPRQPYVEPPAPEPPPAAEPPAAEPPSLSALTDPFVAAAAVRQPPVSEPPILGVGAGDDSHAWMKKAVAGLVLVAVLEAAALAWLWSRSGAALQRDGELAVQSRPAAARVTLDDEDLGVTPVTVRRAPGTYTLKVQIGDAEPRVIVVQIRPGVQTAQYLELQAGR